MENDALFSEPRIRTLIADMAKQHRLPTIAENRALADSGLLLGYGASIPAMFEYAATYVDKILKGAKPADLPVEQPTKFVLVVNSKTAKMLGLESSADHPRDRGRSDRVNLGSVANGTSRQFGPMP